MWPRLRQRLLLSVVAATIALLLAEVVARIVLAQWNDAPPPRPAAGSDVLLVQMLQASPHADLVYELQPGLDCRFRGVEVRTNAFGWRGEAPRQPKPPNGFRVLGLGDSVLFGWGVAVDQTGCVALQRELAAALPTKVVEVIDTGVPGYNTVMEAAVLRERGLALQPDVVIVDWVGNDLDLPNFLLAPHDFARLDHCYLVDLARRVWRSSWLDPRTPFEWAPGDGRGHFESDPARVPPQHRHLVGPAAHRAAMESIVAMTRPRGIHVLVTCHYGLPDHVAATCRELGVPVASLEPRIAQWLAAQGDTAAARAALCLSADDPHPTAMVHGFWGELIAAKFRELGWLPR
jgi:hypothetical protein